MTNDVYFPTIRQLAAYEAWCNEQMFDAAAKLSREQLMRTFPFGLGTIHKTLHHVVNVLGHWGGHVPPERAVPAWADYDEAEELSSIAARSEDFTKRVLAGLDAAHAQGVLHQGRRLVQVFHLVGHGTHHRTQVITMLRLMGIDPPFEAGDFAGWQGVNFERGG